MKKKFNLYFRYYLLALFFFSILYLFKKHNVGNDSTISEWLINYQGGFTKRGLVGHINLLTANFFNFELRDTIFFFQVFLVGLYFLLLFNFIKKININRLIILSILSPIFILYPVAEIEVLARKELFIFCISIIYLFLHQENVKKVYKLIIFPIGILIWEPFLFYLTFFLALDIIESKFQKIDQKFIVSLLYYVPTVTISFYIAFNPISPENHEIMANYLKENFNENCYMSCGLLKTKSSILAQFEGNIKDYSFEIFLRYFLIILAGFGPLILLSKYSVLLNHNLLFFRYFNNLLTPILLLLSPVIILFAMGSDWGRWVNISYVFTFLFYFFLFKKNKIKFNEKILDHKKISFLKNKKIFIIIVIIFCFGWNPKTSLKGDVATNPLWKVPYNASKVIFNFINFRILQDSPISKWHQIYIE